jgi:hypothetical protein
MEFFTATETWVMKWCAPLVRRWRAPVMVTALALAAAFILLLTSPDLGDIANLFLVVPLVCLILIVLLLNQSGGTKLVCLTLLCFYVLTSWQVTRHWVEVRSDLRWMAGSRYFKSKVLEASGCGDWKTALWDGWGMFAQDTNVYLVFSPDDGLRNYSPAHLQGLPVPVAQVQRLERGWYSVTFYTNEGWEDCSMPDLS